MALARPPQRFALQELEEMYARTRIHHRVLLMAIMEERRRRRQRAQRQRRPRSCWQRVWVSLRMDNGQFHGIFDVLDRHFQGKDYRNYLRLDRDILAELLYLWENCKIL